MARPVLRASYARCRQLREQYDRGLVPSDSGTGVSRQCWHNRRPSASRGISCFMPPTVPGGRRRARPGRRVRQRRPPYVNDFTYADDRQEHAHLRPAARDRARQPQADVKSARGVSQPNPTSTTPSEPSTPMHHDPADPSTTTTRSTRTRSTAHLLHSAGGGQKSAIVADFEVGKYQGIYRYGSWSGHDQTDGRYQGGSPPGSPGPHPRAGRRVSSRIPCSAVIGRRKDSLRHNLLPGRRTVRRDNLLRPERRAAGTPGGSRRRRCAQQAGAASCGLPISVSLQPVAGPGGFRGWPGTAVTVAVTTNLLRQGAAASCGFLTPVRVCRCAPGDR